LFFSFNLTRRNTHYQLTKNTRELVNNGILASNISMLITHFARFLVRRTGLRLADVFSLRHGHVHPCPMAKIYPWQSYFAVALFWGVLESSSWVDCDSVRFRPFAQGSDVNSDLCFAEKVKNTTFEQQNSEVSWFDIVL
jgi:hypothetical protein